MNTFWSFPTVVAAFAILGSSCQAQSRGHSAGVSAMQGVVDSVSGNILVLDLSRGPATSRRQIDVSSAAYQDSNGESSKKFALIPGMRILIVVDASAPRYVRPPLAGGGLAESHHVILLPAKALVIERILSGKPSGARRFGGHARPQRFK